MLFNSLRQSATRYAAREHNAVSSAGGETFTEQSRPYYQITRFNPTTLVSIDIMEAEQSPKGCRLLRGRISIPPSKSKRTVGTCCKLSSRRRSSCLIIDPVASRFGDGGCLYPPRALRL